MSKKVFDLSVNNQTTADRRILIAESGKEYDVSFVPALLNRRFYVTWVEYQGKIMSLLTDFLTIRQNLSKGSIATAEEKKKIKKFTNISKEAAESGTELIVYALKANGYDEFNEEELYTNFSETGISKAINFIMGIEDTKKKEKSKVKNS